MDWCRSPEFSLHSVIPLRSQRFLPRDGNEKRRLSIGKLKFWRDVDAIFFSFCAGAFRRCTKSRRIIPRSKHVLTPLHAHPKNAKIRPTESLSVGELGCSFVLSLGGVVNTIDTARATDSNGEGRACESHVQVYTSRTH